MDQTNGSTAEGLELQPPPYSPSNYEQNSYTGMAYQVGKGNIAVVSPPGSYNNMVHAEDPPAFGGDQYCSEAPPMYTYESEETGFSVASIRRGFVRKVYLTLVVQLLFTVGIICTFLYWCDTDSRRNSLNPCQKPFHLNSYRVACLRMKACLTKKQQ